MMLSSDMHIPFIMNFPMLLVLANTLKGNSNRAIVALFRRMPALSLTTPLRLLSSQIHVSQALFSFPVLQGLLQSVNEDRVKL